MDIKHFSKPFIWLLLLTGIASTALATYNWFDTGKIRHVPVALSGNEYLFDIPIRAETRVKIDFLADLSGRSVQEEKEADGDVDYTLRYRFPIQISLETPEGRVISQKERVVSWDDGNRMIKNMNVGPQGGRLSLSTSLLSAVPKTGKIVIKITGNSDEKYLTTINNATLKIEDNLKPYVRYFILGAFLIFCALILNKVRLASQALVSDKKRMIAFLLCGFLGIFGAQRFYVGRPVTAVLMLLTGGGFGVMYLYDLICIAVGIFLDSEGKKLLTWT